MNAPRTIFIDERTYLASGAWGIETQLDLHGCTPATIRSADAIQAFTAELCRRIGMRSYGPCQVVNFGADERVAGYSLVQLIETSLISGHFADATDAAYLNIFSCKWYDQTAAMEYARGYFGARTAAIHVGLRM